MVSHAQEVIVKRTLVHALSSCVAGNQKRRAVRFLEGLSADELEYIAEFLGACIMEHSPGASRSRTELADCITAFERCSRPGCLLADSLSNQEHKMILLLEYLCRSGLKEVAVAARQRA